MALYNIVFKKSVTKDVKSIPKKDLKKILVRIKKLEKTPRPKGVEKLTNQEQYRVRQEKYRILYTIEDTIICITIIKIGHRKSVYKK